MVEKREQRKLYKEEQRIAEVEREIQEKKEKQRRYNVNSIFLFLKFV